MKHSFIILLFFLQALTIHAQFSFYNATCFPFLGKATQETKTPYDRLPDSLENILRKPLWHLSLNTAGMAVRFRTNSTAVVVRWESRFDFHMSHMTDLGVKGLDLYCLEDNNKWRFVRSAQPTGKKNEVTIISNMQAVEREFMLYLPLYDGITSLSIGVDSLATISPPKIQLPIREKPVVFYGTSILQGGCASRPGMASTNIIARRLNRECINLGFSGNAFLDLDIARVMAKVDASAFVLDFVPNASVEQMKDRMVSFYDILRNSHKYTPIIFIEDPIFVHSFFDQAIAKEIGNKNKTLNSIFNYLKHRGERNIYLVSSKSMLGSDGEATVDGIHFTDLGFTRYVNLVCPVLKRVLHDKKIK